MHFIEMSNNDGEQDFCLVLLSLHNRNNNEGKYVNLIEIVVLN